MSKVKVKSFKNTLNGQIIPTKQTNDNGLVGKAIEDVLKKQGVPIDSKNQGADVQEFDLEVKSRKKGSRADVTIGSTTVEDMINNDYEKSIIKGKLQTIRWVEYSDDVYEGTNGSVVLGDKVLDFTDPLIQQELEKQYNFGLNEIISNNNSYKIYDRVGWWEKKTQNSWAFRVPYSNWSRYITYSETNESFNTMFSNEFTNTN